MDGASATHRGEIGAALELVLAEPPYGVGVDEAKVRPVLFPSCFASRTPAKALMLSSATQSITLTLVLSILNSTKSTDIPAIVKALSPVNQVSLISWACPSSPASPPFGVRLRRSCRDALSLRSLPRRLTWFAA